MSPPSGPLPPVRHRFVLLDVGGTLIAPRSSYGAVYEDVLRSFGIDLPAARLDEGIRHAAHVTRRPPGIDRFAGGEAEFWSEFAGAAVERAGGPRVGAEIVQALRDAFRAPERWRLFPDVVPTLERLRREGVRTGVVSNWDSRLPAILDSLGIAGYFEEIGVSGVEGVEKPSPELFHVVLSRMGADPAETIHVGDDPLCDVEGAMRAGVTARLIDRTGTRKAWRDLTPLPSSE